VPARRLPILRVPRCYGHLKAAALNGGRDDLTPEELAFVGFTEPRRSEDPWRPASIYAGILESLDPEVRETFTPGSCPGDAKCGAEQPQLHERRAILELPAASQIDFVG
jgi:hypothetical protein